MASSELCLSSNWPAVVLERERNLRNQLTPAKGQCSSENPFYFTNGPLTEQESPDFGNRLKLCGCVAGSECRHSYESQVLVPDSSNSAQDASKNKRIPLPLSLIHGVPRSEGFQIADALAGQGSRTMSYPDMIEHIFLPMQNIKGTSHDMYRRGDVGETVRSTWEACPDRPVDDMWLMAKLKADIVAHPLFDQLLAAHVACLRLATPVEHYHAIDGHLANKQHIAAKYAMLSGNVAAAADAKEDIDHFMVSYMLLLRSFKEQLREHLNKHASEAVSACWELEQALYNLTGATVGGGTGATMSDDENENEEIDFGYNDSGTVDCLGFGPVIPTDTERTLMQHIRQELKHELKQNYRSKLTDVREEILRKRRAGKLPGDTASVLKDWWNAHSKWPYPTEEDKAKLVEQTGLELKQVNNWFINQRKRNWQTLSSSPTFPSACDMSSENECVDFTLSFNPDTQEPPNKRYMQESGSSWPHESLRKD